MKTIAIVTDGDTKLDEFLAENLRMVFIDQIHIDTYYTSILGKDSIIQADAILVMTPERIDEILPVAEGIILPIARTLMEDTIYPIFSIPSGTDVLIVNDAPDTTLQMMDCLEKIGIRHLNLIPYYPFMDTSHIRLAITPGESRCVPAYIEHIIDVGNRYIDISTFLRLMEVLDLHDDPVSKNLITYSNRIISLDFGIKNKYRELSVKSKELDEIINMSGEGILMTRENGEITVCNKSFLRIMDIDRNIVMDDISTIFTGETAYLLEKNELHNEILQIGRKFININKKTINHLGAYAGMYFNFQEITYIKKLEMNLSEKLRTTGQRAKYHFTDIITHSPEMNRCKKLGQQIADTDLTVLITGESGTGKELLAQSIHNTSQRKNQPFVAINCAAMPTNLLESELFGYESGAFTGALKSGKKGLIEQAHHGTVFLDEIGDMPIVLQTKLLRVLQEKQIMRIGSQRITSVDVRFVVATNKDLYSLTKNNLFRIDLYYRINGFQIHIPPLRDRKEDIPLLLTHFMDFTPRLDDQVKNLFENHLWEGNVRELMNVAAYILAMGGELFPQNRLVNMDILPPYLIHQQSHSPALQLPNHSSKPETDDLFDKKDALPPFTLPILNIFAEKEVSMGRTTLITYLSKKNISLSQARAKDILSQLKKAGYITSTAGRGGSKITAKGRQLLKEW